MDIEHHQGAATQSSVDKIERLNASKKRRRKARSGETPERSQRLSRHAAQHLMAGAVAAAALAVVGMAAVASQGAWALRGAQASLASTQGWEMAKFLQGQSRCEAQAFNNVKAANPDGFKALQEDEKAATGGQRGARSPAALVFSRDIGGEVAVCLTEMLTRSPPTMIGEMTLQTTILTTRNAQASLGEKMPLSPQQKERENAAIAFARQQNNLAFEAATIQNAEWLRQMSEVCAGVLGKIRCVSFWASGRDWAQRKALFNRPELALNQEPGHLAAAAAMDQGLWKIDHPDAQSESARDIQAAMATQDPEKVQAAYARDKAPSMASFEKTRAEQAQAIERQWAAAASERAGLTGFPR